MMGFLGSWNVFGIAMMVYHQIEKLFPLILILLFFTGLRVYKLEGNTLTKFRKEIRWASMYNKDREPENWIAGLWFLGYMYNKEGRDGDSQKAYIFGHDSLFQKYLVVEEELPQDVDPDKKPVTIFEREGAFWRVKYSKIKIVPKKMTPKQNQKNAIDKLVKNYKEKRYTTALLHGPPGCGKSMVGVLLAKHFLKTSSKVFFVDTFVPTDPGDEFISLYTKVEPTEASPLIVVLEEIDVTIEKIHTGEVKVHNDLPVLIKNKPDWNMFLDKFDRERFPFVILLMTSNRDIGWFNEKDPSYFRDGRVNVKIRMN